MPEAEAAARIQACWRGRLTRKEAAPFFEASRHNRALELGAAAPGLTATIGAAPRVQTHPLSEACLMIKTRALAKLDAKLEFRSDAGDRAEARDGMCDGHSWICACRAVDVAATEAWLCRRGDIHFGLNQLKTAAELEAHMDPPPQHDEQRSTTIISYEAQAGGHLVRATSSFPNGVSVFPDSQRSFSMWLTVQGAQAEVSLSAKALFSAFETARREKVAMKRQVAQVIHLGIQMQNTCLSAHKFQVPSALLPRGVTMLVLYVCRKSRPPRTARGSKKRPDGLCVLAVDFRVFVPSESDKLECAICLEPVGDETSCAHCKQSFHSGCRKDWTIACRGFPTCPLCRGSW
jgi:hypothetical protein